VSQIIRLHRSAPDKPPAGLPCNGCGVCCASEPCPLGILVSRKRKGACKALQWSEADSSYRCGLIVQPAQYLPRGLGWLSAAVSRIAYRYISAGSGCDSTLQIEQATERRLP